MSVHWSGCSLTYFGIIWELLGSYFRLFGGIIGPKYTDEKSVAHQISAIRQPMNLSNGKDKFVMNEFKLPFINKNTDSSSVKPQSNAELFA